MNKKIIFGIGVFFLILIISVVSLSFTSPQSNISFLPHESAKIILDKKVYSPGDEVNLEVHFSRSWISTVELLVIEGPHTENRIFSTVENISDNSKPLKIKFTLPEESEFYQYLIQTMLMGEKNPEDFKIISMNPVIFYTKEGADKMQLTDFSIDFGNAQGQIRPGQSVPIKFDIVDGLDNKIPNVKAQVGICDESRKKAPGFSSVFPGTNMGNPDYEWYSGCIFSQGIILASLDGDFDFNMEIPNDAPKGKYILNIWSSFSYPHDKKLVKSLDVTISGEPINPDEHPIIVYANKEIDYGDHPESLKSSRKLNQGQEINFYSFQTNPSSGKIIGNPHDIPESRQNDCCIGQLPAIPNVIVQVTVTDPERNIVYKHQANGGKDGNYKFPTFVLTEDLKLGIYEIKYQVTKNGNYIQHVGARNPETFYITESKKFTVDVLGESLDVYFRGIDVKANDMTFDLESKSLSFDLKNVDSTYYNHYFVPDQITPHAFSCPEIFIEQPLLHGFFTTTFNGKEIGTCNSGPGKTALIVGPINEDGKLEIVGSHVIPEFQTIAVMILMISILPIVLISKFKNIGLGY